MTQGQYYMGCMGETIWLLRPCKRNVPSSTPSLDRTERKRALESGFIKASVSCCSEGT